MGRSNLQEVNWSFDDLDTGETLLPPYPVDQAGVSFPRAGKYSEADRYGFQDPLTHWTSGQLKTLTFSTVLFSENELDDIQDQFEQFEKLPLKDEKLGRPHLVVFTLGSVLEDVVFVERVDINVLPPKRNGDAKMISLSFSLRKYTPVSQEQVDPTRSAKESYYLVVRRVEATYEAISKRFYGDPLFGDRLRKRSRGEPLRPSVGKTIKIPSKSIILRELVEPEFHAFDQNNDDANARYQEILESRNARKATV